MMLVKKILFLSSAAIVLPFLVLPVLSEVEGAEDLEQICQQISNSENFCQNMTESECRAQLEKCAAYYDSQSAEIAKDISKTQAQKNTLQSAISTLKKK